MQMIYTLRALFGAVIAGDFLLACILWHCVARYERRDVLGENKP